MPLGSLDCTQKSVSRLSAAAPNRSRAASPLVRRPLCSSGPSCAKTDERSARSAAPVATTPAAVSPFFTNERRLIAVFLLLRTSFIERPPLLCYEPRHLQNAYKSSLIWSLSVVGSPCGAPS